MPSGSHGPPFPVISVEWRFSPVCLFAFFFLYLLHSFAVQPTFISKLEVRGREKQTINSLPYCWFCSFLTSVSNLPALIYISEVSCFCISVQRF